MRQRHIDAHPELCLETSLAARRPLELRLALTSGVPLAVIRLLPPRHLRDRPRHTAPCAVPIRPTALVCRVAGVADVVAPGLIRGDVQAHLAVARVAEQPPSSTPTSLLVRTSRG